MEQRAVARHGGVVRRGLCWELFDNALYSCRRDLRGGGGGGGESIYLSSCIS